MPTRRRHRLPAVTVLATLAASAAVLVAAAPAPAAAPPAAADLLARSAAALQKKDSLHLEVELHALAVGDGSLTDAKLKKLVPPADATLSGDLSKATIQLGGKLAAGGQTLVAGLRASGNELYVQLAGSWYGAKDVKSKSSSTPLQTSPKQLTGALAEILRNGLDVTVSEGPQADGVATWKLEGSFDAKTLKKATKSSGLGTATGSLNLDQLAGKTDVTVLIGRDDELPRSIDLVSTLGPKDIAAAKSSAGGLLPLPSSGTKGIKAESISVTIGMSRFGQAVTFERPETFKPLASLFGALLGGATATKPA